MDDELNEEESLISRSSDEPSSQAQPSASGHDDLS